MAQMARMCVASEQLLFAAQRRENFLRGRHIARVVYAQPMCGTVPCAVGIVDAGFTHQTGGVDGDALSLPGSLCLRSAVVASHGVASTRGRSKDIKCLAVAGFWLRIGGVRFQPGNVFELEKFGDRIRADRKAKRRNTIN